MSAKPMTITPVLNGFIVEVGCQRVVIQAPMVLANEVLRYYLNPNVVEEEYMNNAVNKPLKLNFNPPPGKAAAVRVPSEGRKDPSEQKFVHPDVGGYVRAGREY